jgi:hypothetical protein
MSDFEKAKKRYNKIMNELCYEHLTIGTSLSEGTEEYGMKEMVYECEYLLSTYYEGGHSNNELKDDDYQTWLSNTRRLKTFINKWKEFQK